MNDHLILMAKPRDWPHWPVLPLKKGDETGYLYADGTPTIYLGKMEDARHHSTHSKVVYKSFEAVLEDGWELT